MSSAITDKKDPNALGAAAAGGVGPSILVQDDPTFVRFLALVGAVLTVVGGVALWLRMMGGRHDLVVGPEWSGLMLLVGVSCLLLHAMTDRDLQFRLMYLAIGGLILITGVVLCLIPYPNRMGDLFAGGFVCIFLAIAFLMAVLRHETDADRRQGIQLAVLGVGVALAAVGLIGGTFSTAFCLPYGLLLAVLGLVYLIAFINSRGSDELAFRVGWVVLALGGLTFLIALGRSIIPPLLVYMKWRSGVGEAPGGYFIPAGLALMVLGGAYAAGSYLACSDAPLAVLTRRELGAFFYSPMAYLLLFGFTVVAWVSFIMFFSTLYDAFTHKQALVEPVVRYYVFSLLPAVAMIFVVPVLTMRLLSEEQRSGTLEVLLTAPVEEPTVVLSKFFAGLVMFLFTWVPFFLFLIVMALAGAPFDYRPLLSFGLGLVISGAGMVSMGLFFSSLTRNQLVGAVLTFAGMLCLVAAYVFRSFLQESSPTWAAILKHISFLDSWMDTLQGKVTPTIGFVFYASMAVFFLFLTVKVLESRKWR